MAITHQIAARVLTSADEVAKPLLGRRRDPHQRQLARTPQPQQPLHVAAVGLDPMTGRARHRPGRADHHLDSTLRSPRAPAQTPSGPPHKSVARPAPAAPPPPPPRRRPTHPPPPHPTARELQPGQPRPRRAHTARHHPTTVPPRRHPPSRGTGRPTGRPSPRTPMPAAPADPQRHPDSPNHHTAPPRDQKRSRRLAAGLRNSLDHQRACRLALAARLLCAKAEAGRGLSGRELGVGELLFPFGWASLGG
jgi:hypothetical protein